MTKNLYKEILKTAKRINVNDNSEIAIGRFQGLVEAYKLLGKEFDYTIEKGIICTMESVAASFLWNPSNLSFEWRAK